MPYLKAKYFFFVYYYYYYYIWLQPEGIYFVHYTQIAPAAVPSTDTVTVTVTRHHTRFSFPGAFSFESIFQSLCRQGFLVTFQSNPQNLSSMDSIQNRVEAWIRDQRARILKVSWGPLQWRMRWPPWINGDEREHRKIIQQEYELRKKQLHDLCNAVKAESVADLQDILCCMVLSECVYKVERKLIKPHFTVWFLRKSNIFF